MEDDGTCEMCGDREPDLVFVAGVGLICRDCERREFGPFDEEDA